MSTLNATSMTNMKPAQPYEVPLLDEGTGPAVVMLHGAPEHRNEWQELITLLRSDFRCLAPDLPGFGNAETPPPDYDFSIASQVAFFDRWVSKTLGSEPFVLVVHDIGAIMGMAWAARNSRQVRGLIVMNTVLHADFEWHTMARIWRSPILGRLFMLTLNRFAYRLAFGRDFPEVRRDQIDSMYDGLTPTARQSLLRHFRQMMRSDFFEGWENAFEQVVCDVPTTVLWGAQDPLIPQEYPKRLGGTLKLLPACGHWVPLEQPEQVADEVRRIQREYR